MLQDECIISLCRRVRYVPIFALMFPKTPEKIECKIVKTQLCVKVNFEYSRGEIWSCLTFICTVVLALRDVRKKQKNFFSAFIFLQLHNGPVKGLKDKERYAVL